MRREAQPVLDLNAHHRALRRCHGCGSYARPGGEQNGKMLCEKCIEKARRESDGSENLNTVLEV